MARGRMINNRISLNKPVNSMSDRAQLLYTWTITHLDKRGVIHGDPAVLRSIVIPRRADIGADDVESYIGEWVQASLVVWYEYDDDLWLWFPTFEDNQVGMRPDREPDSGLPCWDDLPEDCRKLAGEHPEDIPPKRREDKLREQKGETRAPTRELQKWPENGVEQSIRMAFQKINPSWADMPGQIHAIEAIKGHCQARGDPGELAPKMIAYYLLLRDGRATGMSDRDKQYWARQPPTPKGMAQCWDRIVGMMHGEWQAGQEEELHDDFPS